MYANYSLSTSHNRPVLEEQAVFFPEVPGSTLTDYLQEVGSVIGTSHIQSIYKNNGLVKIYLTDSKYVREVLDSEITVHGHHPLDTLAKQPSSKITLSKVDPIIPNSYIENLLKVYGTLDSPITNCKLSDHADFSHINSSKREVDLQIYNGTTIPSKLAFIYESVSFEVDVAVESKVRPHTSKRKNTKRKNISADGPKCSRIGSSATRGRHQIKPLNDSAELEEGSGTSYHRTRRRAVIKGKKNNANELVTSSCDVLCIQDGLIEKKSWPSKKTNKQTDIQKKVPEKDAKRTGQQVSRMCLSTHTFVICDKENCSTSASMNKNLTVIKIDEDASNSDAFSFQSATGGVGDDVLFMEVKQNLNLKDHRARKRLPKSFNTPSLIPVSEKCARITRQKSKTIPSVKDSLILSQESNHCNGNAKVSAAYKSDSTLSGAIKVENIPSLGSLITRKSLRPSRGKNSSFQKTQSISNIQADCSDFNLDDVTTQDTTIKKCCQSSPTNKDVFVNPVGPDGDRLNANVKVPKNTSTTALNEKEAIKTKIPQTKPKPFQTCSGKKTSTQDKADSCAKTASLNNLSPEGLTEGKNLQSSGGENSSKTALVPNIEDDIRSDSNSSDIKVCYATIKSALARSLRSKAISIGSKKDLSSNSISNQKSELKICKKINNTTAHSYATNLNQDCAVKDGQANLKRISSKNNLKDNLLLKSQANFKRISIKNNLKDSLLQKSISAPMKDSIYEYDSSESNPDVSFSEFRKKGAFINKRSKRRSSKRSLQNQPSTADSLRVNFELIDDKLDFKGLKRRKFTSTELLEKEHQNSLELNPLSHMKTTCKNKQIVTSKSKLSHLKPYLSKNDSQLKKQKLQKVSKVKAKNMVHSFFDSKVNFSKRHKTLKNKNNIASSKIILKPLKSVCSSTISLALNQNTGKAKQTLVSSYFNTKASPASDTLSIQANAVPVNNNTHTLGSNTNTGNIFHVPDEFITDNLLSSISNSDTGYEKLLAKQDFKANGPEDLSCPPSTAKSSVHIGPEQLKMEAIAMKSSLLENINSTPVNNTLDSDLPMTPSQNQEHSVDDFRTCVCDFLQKLANYPPNVDVLNSAGNANSVQSESTDSVLFANVNSPLSPKNGDRGNKDELALSTLLENKVIDSKNVLNACKFKNLRDKENVLGSQNIVEDNSPFVLCKSTGNDESFSTETKTILNVELPAALNTSNKDIQTCSSSKDLTDIENHSVNISAEAPVLYVQPSVHQDIDSRTIFSENGNSKTNDELSPGISEDNSAVENDDNICNFKEDRCKENELILSACVENRGIDLVLEGGIKSKQSPGERSVVDKDLGLIREEPVAVTDDDSIIAYDQISDLSSVVGSKMPATVNSDQNHQQEIKITSNSLCESQMQNEHILKNTANIIVKPVEYNCIQSATFHIVGGDVTDHSSQLLPKTDEHSQDKDISVSVSNLSSNTIETSVENHIEMQQEIKITGDSLCTSQVQNEHLLKNNIANIIIKPEDSNYIQSATSCVVGVDITDHSSQLLPKTDDHNQDNDISVSVSNLSSNTIETSVENHIEMQQKIKITGDSLCTSQVQNEHLLKNNTANIISKLEDYNCIQSATSHVVGGGITDHSSQLLPKTDEHSQDNDISVSVSNLSNNTIDTSIENHIEMQQEIKITDDSLCTSQVQSEHILKNNDANIIIKPEDSNYIQSATSCVVGEDVTDHSSQLLPKTDEHSQDNVISVSVNNLSSNTIETSVENRIEINTPCKETTKKQSEKKSAHRKIQWTVTSGKGNTMLLRRQKTNPVNDPLSHCSKLELIDSERSSMETTLCNSDETSAKSTQEHQGVNVIIKDKETENLIQDDGREPCGLSVGKLVNKEEYVAETFVANQGPNTDQFETIENSMSIPKPMNKKPLRRKRKLADIVAEILLHQPKIIKSDKDSCGESNWNLDSYQSNLKELQGTENVIMKTEAVVNLVQKDSVKEKCCSAVSKNVLKGVRHVDKSYVAKYEHRIKSFSKSDRTNGPERIEASVGDHTDSISLSVPDKDCFKREFESPGKSSHSRIAGSSNNQIETALSTTPDSAYESDELINQPSLNESNTLSDSHSDTNNSDQESTSCVQPISVKVECCESDNVHENILTKHISEHSQFVQHNTLSGSETKIEQFHFGQALLLSDGQECHSNSSASLLNQNELIPKTVDTPSMDREHCVSNTVMEQEPILCNMANVTNFSGEHKNNNSEIENSNENAELNQSWEMPSLDFLQYPLGGKREKTVLPLHINEDMFALQSTSGIRNMPALVLASEETSSFHSILSESYCAERTREIPMLHPILESGSCETNYLHTAYPTPVPYSDNVADFSYPVESLENSDSICVEKPNSGYCAFDYLQPNTLPCVPSNTALNARAYIENSKILPIDSFKRPLFESKSKSKDSLTRVCAKRIMKSILRNCRFHPTLQKVNHLKGTCPSSSLKGGVIQKNSFGDSECHENVDIDVQKCLLPQNASSQFLVSEANIASDEGSTSNVGTTYNLKVLKVPSQVSATSASVSPQHSKNSSLCVKESLQNVMGTDSPKSAEVCRDTQLPREDVFKSKFTSSSVTKTNAPRFEQGECSSSALNSTKTFVVKSVEIKPDDNDIYSVYKNISKMNSHGHASLSTHFPLSEKKLNNFLQSVKQHKDPKKFALKVLAANNTPDELKALIIQLYDYFKVCNDEKKRLRISRLIILLQ